MELIILGVCAFILIFNLFISFTRGTRKSLLRLLTVVVAAVASFFLARAVAGKFGTEVALWLQATVGADPNFAPMFSGAVSADDAIAVFVKMILAPLLFLLFYMALKGVLILVYWLLANATRPEYQDKARTHVIALPIGLVIALIGIFVFISPVFGYLNVASEAITTADRGTGNETVAELATYNAEFIEPAKNTPACAALYNLLGDKLFDGLTMGKWQEEKIYLRSEAVVLADIVGNVQILGSREVEQYGDAECAALDAVAQDIGKSHILSVLCSGVLNTASNHWLEGKDFMGIAAPDIGTSGNILLNAFLKVFSTSTWENIGADLDFFVDVFALAVKHDMLVSIRSSDDAALSALMVDSGFLAEVQALLTTHPRMDPVGVALIDIGMRNALKAMGLPESVSETCGPLLADMAAALQQTPVKANGGIDDASLKSSLLTVFADNEIEINEASTQLVAQGVAEYFTPQEVATLTTEQLVAKLAERFEAVNISDLAAAQQALTE